MKKSHLIIGIVIVVIIIGIAIGIYFSNEKGNTSDEKESQSMLSIINARVKTIQDKIDNEMKALQLSREMEVALDRLLDRICMMIGALLTGITASICYLFYSNGSDLLTAILTTAGLAALTFPTLSLLAWKTISFDFVVTKSRDLIKQWLCRKYGHNPGAIAVLTASIAENTRVMNELVLSTDQLQ